MHQDQATFRFLIHYGGAISQEAEAFMKADRNTFAKLLPQVRADVSALLGALWTYSPDCFLDKSRELGVLDKFFCESMVDALMSTEASYRDFFFRYLTAAFAIPLRICHFVVAADYFERGYLFRPMERNETFFAIAVHDCFTGDDFRHVMDDLLLPDIETFIVPSAIESIYIFARCPGQKEKVVFVQRVRFHRILQLYCFSLMNGLHHGHAPCVCQNCSGIFSPVMDTNPDTAAAWHPRTAA